jgi:hypothetical protein
MKKLDFFKVFLAASIAAVGVSAQAVSLEQLEDRNGVYFYKDKPYSGKIDYDCMCDGGDEYAYSGNMINGKLTGAWKEFRMGTLVAAGNYKDGKKHGEWKEIDFYGSGRKSVQNYDNGKEIGARKEFDENGKLIN